MRPSLPAPQGPQPVCLPSRFPPYRIQYITEKDSRYHFLTQLMDLWMVFRGYGVVFNQWTKWDDGPIEWFTKAPFVWCFPIKQSVLNMSQGAVTLSQMSLLSFCVLLTQQSHLFLNDEGLMCNDSTLGLHRLCQVPGNCQCKWLLAPRTFASSFQFPEKFFCTDTTGSIG